MSILKFISHGRRVQALAALHGWRSGARYTNLRDVRSAGTLGLLDIPWKTYCYERHLAMTALHRPLMTVAQDIECHRQSDRVLAQARELKKFTSAVIIVPKHTFLDGLIKEIVAERFLLGYSVPTRYGGTLICPEKFIGPVHLLGGRPDVQRNLAKIMQVVSIDGNRFTLDAAFGDFFDGERFRPHPVGGYQRCLEESIININRIWKDYEVSPSTLKD